MISDPAGGLTHDVLVYLGDGDDVVILQAG